MSKLIAVGLSPNTNFSDAVLALSVLLSPWRWIEGRSISSLEKKLSSWLGMRFCFAFESGRSSLFAVLSSFDLKKRSEVLLQAYTCVAVADAVIWAGLKPVYVDIDNDFNMSPDDLRKKITSKSRVLIIQHTFGSPAKLDELLKIASDSKLKVVEDCAHALGSQYKKRKLGTFGDAAIFSFGRDKVISSVFGGAAVTNDEKLADKISKFQNKSKLPSRSWVVNQLIYPILAEIVKRTYSFGIGKLLMEVLRRLRILSKAVYPQEKKGEKPPFVPSKMPNGLSILALYQMKKLEKFNKKRRELADVYFENKKSLPFSFPMKNSGSNYLRFTVLTQDAREIREFCSRKNIYLGDWYSYPIAPRGVYYDKIFYKGGSCPNAEKLSRLSLNLPTNPHLERKDVKRVIEAVGEFYADKD